MISQEESQWSCPKCTLLVDVKFFRCHVCDSRKPRSVCVTPEVEESKTQTTPEIQKKQKKTRKRKLEFTSPPKKTTLTPKNTSVLATHARDRQRVNRELSKPKKKTTRKRGEYTVYDIHRDM